METYTCKVPFLMFHNMKELEFWGIIHFVVLNEYMCKRGLAVLIHLRIYGVLLKCKLFVIPLRSLIRLKILSD